MSMRTLFNFQISFVIFIFIFHFHFPFSVSNFHFSVSNPQPMRFFQFPVSSFQFPVSSFQFPVSSFQKFWTQPTNETLIRTVRDTPRPTYGASSTKMGVGPALGRVYP